MVEEYQRPQPVGLDRKSAYGESWRDVATKDLCWNWIIVDSIGDNVRVWWKKEGGEQIVYLVLRLETRRCESQRSSTFKKCLMS